MLVVLIVFVGTLLQPFESSKITSSPESPADRSTLPIEKRESSCEPIFQSDHISFLEQPLALEGQFIPTESNSEHLFRPYDFMKEKVVQLDEGDTKDTKANDKVR
jgi:hypothetical protein